MLSLPELIHYESGRVIVSQVNVKPVLGGIDILTFEVLGLQTRQQLSRVVPVRLSELSVELEHCHEHIFVEKRNNHYVIKDAYRQPVHHIVLVGPVRDIACEVDAKHDAMLLVCLV